MDLETGIFTDDPEFEGVIDRLSNNLFQISSNNGRVSELLRRQAKGNLHSSYKSNGSALLLVQDNQLLFRQLKSEIEAMQLWTDPTPSQKYSQHKLSSDFAKLFKEFKQLQERVIDSAKSQQDIPYTDIPDNRDTIELPMNNFDTVSSQQQHQIYADDVADQEAAFNEQLRQDEVSYQQGLVAEREQEIEHMAQGMNELNEIFESLGEIVREQGITLDNIESNMYSMASNVYSGSQQLVKAHRWQRATSGRMCCFLMILLVMLLVVVIAVSF